MDLATIFGLILAVGAIAGAFSLEGGRLEAIFLAGPMLIVIGGTLGATIITTSIGTVRRVPRYLKLALTGNTHNALASVNQIVTLAEKARREGILGLDADLAKIRDPFFHKALQLVVDGT
ncbi:MAG: motility-associated protein, partial [candidate division Zixibacteria bacterium]